MWYLAGPSSGSRATVRSHLHSSATGDSATRGGFTIRQGAGVSPAKSSSLCPRGSGAEVAFIASRKSQVARLQTNSPVSSAKVIASL